MREDTVLKKIYDVVCVRETDKAILVEPAGYDGEEKVGQWIPKSQMHPSSQVNIAGDVGILIISEWIYEKKEWGPYNTKGPKENG